MTTTTQLKPGDVVRHSEHGYGIFYVAAAGSLVMHRNAKGHVAIDDLDEEWERVETCTADAVRILEDYQQIVSKSAGVVVRDAVVMMTTAAYEAYRGREIVKPGHVQVRVDDLDPQTLSEWSQGSPRDLEETALLRIGRAFVAPQPDEPTEFGARITLTLKDGARERWLRTGIHNPWQRYLGDGEMIYGHWDELTERGTVTIGWSVEDD